MTPTTPEATLSGPFLYMDAVITPNRSLSRRGLAIVLGLMVFYNLVLGLLMLVIGAFPVPIFLGLDVAGLFLAFHVSNRRARNAERVQVTADQVKVIREQGLGPRTVWASPTAFTRVAVENAGEHELRVRLTQSGRFLTVAGELSPKERGAFAAALERAIGAARAERHGSPA